MNKHIREHLEGNPDLRHILERPDKHSEEKVKITTLGMLYEAKNEGTPGRQSWSEAHPCMPRYTQ